MKLCIPIKENKGLKSEVYSHFGSSSAFIIYDINNENIELLDNSDQHHVHGKCNPINSISGKNIEVVIVGGIGARAINKLQAENIKVFQSKPGTVEYNVNMFKKSLLKEITEQEACVHHSSGNGCSS